MLWKSKFLWELLNDGKLKRAGFPKAAQFKYLQKKREIRHGPPVEHKNIKGYCHRRFEYTTKIKSLMKALF